MDYLQYLPPELHHEIKKFQRGNYSKCDPLLIVEDVVLAQGRVVITGKALTQFGEYDTFGFQFIRGTYPFS